MPDSGYAVSRVIVDGVNVGAVRAYTFEDVTGSHTIEVTFYKIGGSPKSGDSGGAAGWLAALVLSALGFTGTALLPRKRRVK